MTQSAGSPESHGLVSSATLVERTLPPAEWNQTAVEWPQYSNLSALIAEQVHRTPEAPALTFGETGLSYAELDRRTNQLARRLQRQGVRANTLVGISVERSLEMVIGLLGILKAGGAYVPLDPGDPKDRLAFMIDDADVDVLLTQEHVLPGLPNCRAQRIVLDAPASGLSEESTEPIDSPAGRTDLAYMIYTSGSTGRPKGAMNSHRGIINRLLWMQRQYTLTPADTVLQKTPFSFDVSVWEFFWPLIAGARLAIARPGGHQDPAYLVDTVAREGVTVMHFVPSMLRTFLQERNVGACRTLRDVICSGEALTADLQQAFFSRLDARLHNLYGPTEAAVDVTHWTCVRDSDDPVVPIGRPVANTQIHILDEALRPVAIGESGELHIGGVQVGAGYHRRPELTAERFIPDPFSGELGAFLYKTGDLARFRRDGTIEFLGRIDFQVKIRGFRIELGEIESALGQHPAIAQSVVVAADHPAGGQRLIAYLTSRSSIRPTATDLRDNLAARLPEYMVPSLFHWLDAIPLSPSGKVDRRALPAPTRKRPDVGNPYVAPRTELERFIAAVWSDLLCIDDVGLRDRFFELGGTSLLAAEFVNRIRRELGQFMYVVAVFTAPTVGEFAALVRKDYPDAVARRFPSEVGVAPAADALLGGRVGPALLDRMRGCVPRLTSAAPASDLATPRNPRALFVLAPPRSGTTLLRVMLAGHPGLFAASELQLLNFHTMPERRAAFSGKHQLWLEGLLRAVMEIRGCDADEAKRIVEDGEARGLTTREFYGELQSWIAPRMLVDKSPQYTLDEACLHKAERDFDAPLYVHLVRHPYATIRSFEDYHMDQVLFLREQPFTPRQLGELVWTLSHQTVLEFLASVPAARQFRLSFEDLTTGPEPAMRALCAQFGLAFHDDLLQPYRNTERKMVDGLHRQSTPMGDTHFRDHGAIDGRVADKWKGVIDDDFLGDVTWEVAERLGYARPIADPAVEDGAPPVSTRDRQKQLRQRARAADPNGVPRG